MTKLALTFRPVHSLAVNHF